MQPLAGQLLVTLQGADGCCTDGIGDARDIKSQLVSVAWRIQERWAPAVVGRTPGLRTWKVARVLAMWRRPRWRG